MTTDFRGRTIVKPLVLASIAFLLIGNSASALPSNLLKSQILASQNDAKAKPASASSKASAQKDTRDPVVMKIGNRKHLFDGDFLCEVNAHPHLPGVFSE